MCLRFCLERARLAEVTIFYLNEMLVFYTETVRTSEGSLFQGLSGQIQVF